MSINLHINPDLTRFKEISIEKMRELNSPFNGKKESSEENKNQKESDKKSTEQKQEHRRGPTPKWLKLLFAALAVAVAIPVITWIWERIAALIRAARNVEAALG